MMTATELSTPIPAAAEDQPVWYRILGDFAAGNPMDDTTVRVAAIAALADHDLMSAELARYGMYLADARDAAAWHVQECREP